MKMLFKFSSIDSDDNSKEEQYLNKELTNQTIKTNGEGKSHIFDD